MLTKVYFVSIKGCMIKRLKTHDLKQNVCITYSSESEKSSRKSKEKITGNKYTALSIKGFTVSRLETTVLNDRAGIEGILRGYSLSSSSISTSLSLAGCRILRISSTQNRGHFHSWHVQHFSCSSQYRLPKSRNIQWDLHGTGIQNMSLNEAIGKNSTL